MKNGQIKLQNDTGWVAMLYTEIPDGIQVESTEHVIDYIKGATVNVKLASGEERAGFASDAGRVMFK